MQQPFAKPISFIALLGVMAVAGCQKTPPSAPAPSTASPPASVIAPVTSIEPSASSSQAIAQHRAIFIQNISRAEQGIRQLASQQAMTATPLTDGAVNAQIAMDNPSQNSHNEIEEETDISLLLQEELKPKTTVAIPANASVTVPSPTLSPMATLDSETAGRRYDIAMAQLYSDSPLSSGVYDTLMDIAVFAPQLFGDAEINRRLQYHSPAMARLVNQQQVWRQLDASRQQQSVQLRKDQEIRFNQQLDAFNKTIAEYDKKIAEYQVRLTESDRKNPQYKAKAEEAARYEKKQ